ncbi:hypothetical protein QA804_36385 [Streptomyces scabiei]
MEADETTGTGGPAP